MRRLLPNTLLSVRTISVLLVVVFLSVGVLTLHPADGSRLPSRSLIISNTAPSATANYQLGFTILDSETLATVTLAICTDDPWPTTPCTAPPGINMNNATLTAQTGVSDFVISSHTANSIVLSRTAASVAANTPLTFDLSGITNPSLADTYYGRIQTFPTADTTGASTDVGGVAVAINNSVQVSATVPPYLYFCVGLTINGTDCATASGDYINFGDFSPAVTSVGTTQMVAAGNPATGFVITANGSTLTSGVNIISNLTSPDTARPGVEQFGLNLVANQAPSVGKNPSGEGSGVPSTGYNRANFYKFVSGDVIVSVPNPDAPRAYTASYIANVTKNQAPGVYAATIIYVATGQF